MSSFIDRAMSVIRSGIDSYRRVSGELSIDRYRREMDAVRPSIPSTDVAFTIPLLWGSF